MISKQKKFLKTKSFPSLNQYPKVRSQFYRPWLYSVLLVIKIEGLKMEEKQDKRLKELINLAMECMGVAVTIIDMKGTLLYYNRQAAKILDRKSEYIGKDVHSHHKKANSNKNLDLMLQDFQKGRTEPFHYEAKP